MRVRAVLSGGAFTRKLIKGGTQKVSVKVENLEKNMAKITAEIPADKLEKAVQASYVRNKNRFNIPGFRRGKAPRKIIEKMYGATIFYEEAIEEVLPECYEEAAKESGLDIVSDPKYSLESMEPGQPVVYSVEVATRPEVELGAYKGIELTKHTVRIKKEDIQHEIEQERAKNVAQVTVDREAKPTDITVIDYEGFVDGEAFRGGKGENHPLTIGSGQFIPGFEDQVIGHKAGDEFDVNVTFPEDYHAKELAGKEAVFKVAVKEVKENQLPEIDDEFASEVSEFDTLKEWEADIKKNLTIQKKAEFRQEQEEEACAILVENAKFELPDAMVETYARQLMNQQAERMQQSGFSMQQYLQLMNMTVDDMLESMKQTAEKQLSARLVLCAIAKAEGIEPTDEDFDKEIEEMSKAYDMEIEKLKTLMGETGVAEMRRDMSVQNALNFVIDNAKEVAKKEEKKDEAEAEEKPAKKAAKKPAAKKSTKKAADEAEAEAPAEKPAKKPAAKKTAAKKTTKKAAEEEA